MEQRKSSSSPRRYHVTFKQKKKLLQLVTKHPQLIKGKVTQDFNYADLQRLWQQIALECNAVPGARKTWRQWRKSWQDLRSKTKKQQATLKGALPSSVVMFTPAEQEALGLKNVSTAPVAQETPEFVPLETDGAEVNNFHAEIESAPSLSESESPPEDKVFTRAHKSKMKNHKSSKSRQSSSCALHCDLLAEYEKRKLLLKEDYINYKKDYLRKKLKIMREQSEALQIIARELNCEK